MGKNLNPADAFRKAQRKKELKKNKTERSKARDFALVKKDTSELETAIKEFEESRADPAKLAELKAELEKINRKKAEYVEEHPEMRKVVYRRRKQGEPEPELPTKKRNLFKKNGLPRHPERSIYYDRVMNPYGVAPPGMPYVERPLLPGEVDSDAEMEDGSDDDVPLPSDLPPGTELITSDDEITMPDGPPPGKEEGPANPPLPSGGEVPPPLPPNLPPNMQSTPLPPPPPPGFPNASTVVPPPPFPPAGFLAGPPMHIPPPPPGAPWPTGWMGGAPPPPPSFPSFPPFPPNAFPPPPPKFLPRQQSASSMQDPLSSIPHQTFQAHRASQLAPPHPSLPPPPAQSGISTLPPNPSLPPKPTTVAEMAAATVSAEPQLRDFKKEATAFVPTAVKRKKAATAAIDNASSKINAAPLLEPSVSSADGEQDVEVGPARPDLVSALKNQFGSVPAKPAPVPATNPMSDYDKFLEEMGDILGPN
ncbi:WW domain binding protein 11-domain-containing protein [Gymnopilus junonius]|uniref:WW domain binding protein 11-domain-containing protein n=1 Tax=Gymnopilus junonius TaxID=109634 RepID=A0A9P5P2E2_GYMJU|nr:WW domain binding protein 11-domain-containing protein [Gymnopilus junonius]